SGIAWIFVAMFSVMGIIYYGLTAWLPAAYIEFGWSQATTGWLAAVFNIATVPAAITVGIPGPPVSRRSGMLIAAARRAVASRRLAVAPAGAGAWIIFAGLANGAMFTITMSLPLDVADHPVDVGAVAGMMLFIGYVVTALAPTLLGAVRDLTGNFDLVLLTFPVGALVIAACAATLSAARLRRGVRDRTP
ncbi:MAG: hypothetical protein ACKOD0_08295, partial [Actinomycetota bacterium]